MFKKIVLALDGSEHADKAIPVARELAQESGGKIDVVHVREVVGSRAGVRPVLYDEDEVEAKIGAQVADLRGAGIDAELHRFTAIVGGPAHQIAETANGLGADLIVVGTRGHSAIAGLIAGSVTQRLLHLAHCPVLAVPPAAK